jgi:hypothetical protein
MGFSTGTKKSEDCDEETQGGRLMQRPPAFPRVVGAAQTSLLLAKCALSKLKSVGDLFWRQKKGSRVGTF